MVRSISDFQRTDCCFDVTRQKTRRICTIVTVAKETTLKTTLLGNDIFIGFLEKCIVSTNEDSSLSWLNSEFYVLFNNWFMLSVRISSYGCTQEVWRT